MTNDENATSVFVELQEQDEYPSLLEADSGRRKFLAAALGFLATGGIASSMRPAGAASTFTATARKPKTFVLVHGAWHGAQHWDAVARLLRDEGHTVLAVDLPAHGRKARFPSSYLAIGQKGFDLELSPVRDVSLDTAAATVIAALKSAQGVRRPILVGHSAGGTVITRVGELVPDLIGRLVYLSAFVPVGLTSSADYGALHIARTGYGSTLFIGDADRIGAFRINPRGDREYLRQLHEAYYQDVDFETFLPFGLTLTPDLPHLFYTTNQQVSAKRWGRIPRSFIRCEHDRAMAPKLQYLMIRDADQRTPHNRFDVHSLQSSHSPFASQPDHLAKILSRLA